MFELEVEEVNVLVVDIIIMLIEFISLDDNDV